MNSAFRSIINSLPLLALLSTSLTANTHSHDTSGPYEKSPFEGLDTFATNDWWNRGDEKYTLLKVNRDQVLAFGLYTVARDTLKLTAQLYPLYPKESRTVYLDIKVGDQWTQIAKAPIYEIGWTAHFRINDWDSTKTVPYRLRHGESATFEGLVRADPVDKDEIVMASLSCNSIRETGMRPNIVRNLKEQDPDILYFAGDQVYPHRDHTPAWILFGLQFRDIMRDRPTITIPDDHDIGQANLWGEGGVIAESETGDSGGYFNHPDYVRMVERAQTWHLPDPYDSTPIKNGIGVYYTTYPFGGLDLAIIEDRKFKTGPKGRIPLMGKRVDLILAPDYDANDLDLPGLELLGKRQLSFLQNWAQDKDGKTIKAVLSQTGFCGASHFGRNPYKHKKEDMVRVYADLDSNGWPRSGRNAALELIREAGAIHIAGDQHLATVIRHGINDYDDGPWAFISPAIVNTIYSRSWIPTDQALAATQPIENSELPYTGRFEDGFLNKLTMHAYANPKSQSAGAGYALLRFKKEARHVVFECWPRDTDITQPDARQFPGWPITIDINTQEKVEN